MTPTLYSAVSMVLFSLFMTVPALADTSGSVSDSHMKLDGEVTERSGFNS
jgi:hypothetical protein